MKSKKIFNILTGLCLSTTLLSCSHSGFRNPSSAPPRAIAVAENLSLSGIIQETSNLAKSDPTNDVCAANYDLLYKDLINLTYDMATSNANDLKKIDEAIKSSFMARIDLQESFKNFKQTVSDSCLKSATDVFRGLRYMEDYLIEKHAELINNAPTEYIDLMGEFPYLLVNPKFKDSFNSYKDLISGDLILSRGNAFSSAAIARISANDYQFSHLSFVYKNPKTKALYTTEAHIEIGSVAEPIIEHIEQANVRSVVFRYKDPAIAHKASTYAISKVWNEQNKGKNIQYDFSMNLEDHSKIFCTEVVSLGFQYALPDEDLFPKFKSKFNSGIIPFLNTIGIPVTKENIATKEVFTPGDIQFDPRFEMVAEWRNPEKMQDSRLKDFILTKMFELMDKGNYKIDPTFRMAAKSKVAWLFRRIPIVQKSLKKKFPLNMTTAQLQLFMALEKIGDSFYKELETAALDYDRMMTPSEVYAVLDDFIKRDAEVYAKNLQGKSDEEPLFHRLFHP